MHYQMKVVEDHELPPASRWAFVELNDQTWLLVTRSALSCPEWAAEVVSEAWNAWYEFHAAPVVTHLVAS